MRQSVAALGLAGLLTASCALVPGAPPPCPSPLIDRGGGWHEIGGPRAWLLFDPPYVVTSHGPRKLWIRVDDTVPAGPLELLAFSPDGTTVEGFVQAPVPDDAWAHGSGPPAGLGGSVHFAATPLSQPGCWTLVVGTRDTELGRLLIEVVPPRQE
jgi:hypothetical protein